MGFSGHSFAWLHIRTYLELLFAVVELHEEAMRPVPVAVDDVRPAVPVEVGQSDASAVLHGVLHACRNQR